MDVDAKNFSLDDLIKKDKTMKPFKKKGGIANKERQQKAGNQTDRSKSFTKGQGGNQN